MKKTIITILLALATLTGWAQAKGETVWNNVVMGYANAPVVSVTKVSLCKSHTDVDIRITHLKGRKIGFMPGISLKADGKDYLVKDATVIKLGEGYQVTEDTLDFVLTFEPMPTTTKKFDLVTPDGLQLLNIRSSDILPDGIADTYWRNEATGDWLIGFTPKHVIYNNKVWDIDAQTEQKDSYTLKLNDGTVVKVGKMKKGKRSITIGRQLSILCTPIVTAALPDYPTKDSRKGFVDNGYMGTDSVTIVGWLKDMPDQAWAQGREFKVYTENLISDNQETYHVSMDSLGRFTLRFPLLNSSQVLIDWGRTSLSTVLEPGKKYFFLHDFMTGQKLFMGDDVRVQNELVAYPHGWSNDRIEDYDRGRVSAMEFKALTDRTRATQMAQLKARTDQHPNLSQRYIDYLTGYYLTGQAESMMQARFAIPDRRLPQEYLSFVGRELWQKAAKPYTLYRDFPIFMRDYIDQLHDGHRANRGGETLEAIRRVEQQGLVTLTTDESAALDTYSKLINQLEADLHQAGTSEKIDSLVNAFNTNETVQKVYNLFNRIGDPIRNELAASGIRENLAILDSIGCDRNLRDIYIARFLYRQISNLRQPLEQGLLTFAEKEIKLPSALAAVKTLNDKYVAIQQRDISTSPSLKSPEDVANMSDGEKILRKITEPYRGRLILLDVWGTWCGPCKAALANSKEEYERLKNYNLVYLYLCNRSSDESWKNVIKEYDLIGDDIVHYNLPEGQQTAVENYLGVQYFPTYKLIDRQGNVLDVNADPRDLESFARLLDAF